jgi:hypothetical protein
MTLLYLLILLLLLFNVYCVIIYCFIYYCVLLTITDILLYLIHFILFIDNRIRFRCLKGVCEKKNDKSVTYGQIEVVRMK